jgi:hypothetical protein
MIRLRGIPLWPRLPMLICSKAHRSIGSATFIHPEHLTGETL